MKHASRQPSIIDGGSIRGARTLLRYLQPEDEISLGCQYWALVPTCFVSEYLESESEASMARFGRQKHATALMFCSIVVLLQVGGCADIKPHEPQSTESSSNVVRCTEPRPRLCTQQYLPVCAELKNGTQQTYASGCVACSDAYVVSYRPDPCE